MRDDNSRLIRCQWVSDDPLERAYHDHEWGVPVYHEPKLFEFLILEGAQAGLSWRTILHKRENYRQAFDQFDPALVAQYDNAKTHALLQDVGIVRNRLKIRAAIANAQAFLQVQAELGNFANYLWGFVAGQPIQNQWQTLEQIPAMTSESVAMSKALKKRGFKFVGPTICYALMQATGMVNDHTIDCFRHSQVKSLTR